MINKFSDEYKRIGYNLKKERKKARLTQAQLASKLNKIDDSKISNIENAKEDFKGKYATLSDEEILALVVPFESPDIEQ
ncbi:helix-turn-helix domain-containing protein [Sphingobacterium sp. SG20118]|uniref:helix-turn-helix domain-containing protein n=1 Tax=Sphingobacterium sp. SG20118 TaxID=3367156 RepID=UPI0037DFC42F